MVAVPIAGPDGAPESWPDDLAAAAVLGVGEEAGDEAQTDALVAEGIGAVVYFASALRDPAAAANRSAALQRAALRSPAAQPLLLGVDQEGGRVARLPPGPASLPGAMALGAAGDVELARAVGRATAGQLLALGVCWDLAPVCDLWSRDNPALGSRCFAADPQVCGAMAAAFATGLQDGGVLACGKHFPGHGDTDVDSHCGLPVLRAARTVFEAREWVPFHHVVRAGAASLMMGHLRVPALGPLPASLEPEAYAAVRGVLGFDGLVVTDALGMAGALQAVGGDIGAAAVQALAAGADIVLVAHGPAQQRQALAAIRAALAEGRLARARVDAACRRLIAAKARWRVGRGATPDGAAAPHLLRRPSDVSLGRRVACASITQLRAGPGRSGDPARWTFGARCPAALREAVRARWPGAQVAQDGDLAGVCLDGGCHLLVGPPLPAPLPSGRILLAYDETPASLEALVAAAAGGFVPAGRLPRP